MGRQAGYQGIYRPKSRAKTMSEDDARTVDGCAIFYRPTKYVDTRAGALVPDGAGAHTDGAAASASPLFFDAPAQVRACPRACD